MGVARDQSFLQKEGITMILAIRNTMSAQARMLRSKVAEELGIDSKAIDVAGNQELIAAFPRAIEIINAHLSTMYQLQQAKTDGGKNPIQDGVSPVPGKVLVFCESGNERSATVVTAYIMAMYCLDLVKAVQVVQAQRFAVAFDDPLRNLLSTYDTMLQARRDVFQAGNGVHKHREYGMLGILDGKTLEKRGNSSKRTLDDAYDDDDISMTDGDEHTGHGRYERRGGFAPFQDKICF